MGWTFNSDEEDKKYTQKFVGESSLRAAAWKPQK
jgi:hypothetical protein